MMRIASQAPRREPFSDWRAQVERIIERQTGWILSLRGFGLEAYYDVGLSPSEAATDWIGGRQHHA